MSELSSEVVNNFDLLQDKIQNKREESPIVTFEMAEED